MSRLKLDEEDEQFFLERRRVWKELRLVLHDMSALDTKSSALLTHVSIMIAVLALFLAQSDLAIPWKGTFTVELALFSFVAVALTWCVDIMGPPCRQIPSDVGIEIVKIYRKEILKRRAIYQFPLRSVRALTLFLIITILIKSKIFEWLPW